MANETVEVGGHKYNEDDLKEAMDIVMSNVSNEPTFAVVGEVGVEQEANDDRVYLYTVDDDTIVTNTGISAPLDYCVGEETVNEKLSNDPKEILEELVYDITTVEEFDSEYSDNKQFEQFVVKHKNGLADSEVDALIKDDRFSSMNVEKFGDECGVVIKYVGE